MLKIMGYFKLHHGGQAQDTLGSLVATPSLLSRAIESQGQNKDIVHQGSGTIRYR